MKDLIRIIECAKRLGVCDKVNEIDPNDDKTLIKAIFSPQGREWLMSNYCKSEKLDRLTFGKILSYSKNITDVLFGYMADLREGNGERVRAFILNRGEEEEERLEVHTTGRLVKIICLPIPKRRVIRLYLGENVVATITKVKGAKLNLEAHPTASYTIEE
jgi:hypothetical protein|nr:MAG TPA: hypothetical protein [Caudoviricetes sp.]